MCAQLPLHEKVCVCETLPTTLKGISLNFHKVTIWTQSSFDLFCAHYNMAPLNSSEVFHMQVFAQNTSEFLNVNTKILVKNKLYIEIAVARLWMFIWTFREISIDKPWCGMYGFSNQYWKPISDFLLFILITWLVIWYGSNWRNMLFNTNFPFFNLIHCHFKCSGDKRTDLFWPNCIALLMNLPVCGWAQVGLFYKVMPEFYREDFSHLARLAICSDIWDPQLLSQHHSLLNLSILVLLKNWP